MASSSRAPIDPDLSSVSNTEDDGDFYSDDGSIEENAAEDEFSEMQLRQLYEARLFPEVIRYKKRWKAWNIENSRDQVVCTRCGQTGHANARSALCPERKKKAVSGSKRKRKQTAEEKSKKASAKKERLEGHHDPINRKCGSCSKLCPDFLRENPHASSRMKICPYHKPSKRAQNRETLGAQLEQFVRKCRLSTLIKLPAEEKQRLIQQIENIVDFNRVLMLKATLFTTYYLHHKLPTDDPLSPMLFHQTFFYSVFQLLLNRPISSKNRHFPKQELARAYEQYLQDFPSGGHAIPASASMESGVLTITAKNMAVTFANNVIENFESRYIAYLTLRFRELLPELSKAQWSKLARHIYDHFATETHRGTTPKTGIATELHDRVDTAVSRISEAIDEDLHEYRHQLTLASITHTPQHFLKIMHKVNQYFDAYNHGQIDNAGDVQTEATTPFVHSVLRQLQESRVLGKRRRGRLCRTVVKAINEQTVFAVPNGITLSEDSRNNVNLFIEETRGRIRNSIAYLDPPNNATVTRENCFVPDLNFIVNQQRLFKLLPVPTFTRKFITITEPILRSILLSAEIPTKGILNCFDYAFDLAKVRAGSGTNFADMVSTDGYGCNVHFFRTRRSDETLPDLEDNDFAIWELPYLRVWGADPGMTDVFVASDGGTFAPNDGDAVPDSPPHEIRRFSTVEFYTKTQYKHSTICIQNWKMRSQVSELEQSIATSKITNLQAARLFIASMLTTMGRLLSFYDQRFTKLRFRRYVKEQQSLSELANVFVTGGKKYGQVAAAQKARQLAEQQRCLQSSMEIVRNEKWRKSPIANDWTLPVVGLGNAGFPVTMKGKISGLSGKLSQVLKRAELEGRLVLLKVNEYNTSKVCSFCGQKTLKNVRSRQLGATLHKVLQCDQCKQFWDRDVNAARNMRSIVLEGVAGRGRPEIFTRSANDQEEEEDEE